jgi:hypothetical protein
MKRLVFAEFTKYLVLYTKFSSRSVVFSKAKLKAKLHFWTWTRFKLVLIYHIWLLTTLWQIQQRQGVSYSLVRYSVTLLICKPHNYYPTLG